MSAQGTRPVWYPAPSPRLPEADQEQGGTVPGEWALDLSELLARIDEFSPLDGRVHALFGPLTAAEWHVWAWRHADHHLRQFGL